jgi:hypothetical protein
LSDLLPSAALEFRLQPWRENRVYRNELIRMVALHAVDLAIADLKSITRQLRQLVRFYEMPKTDRNNFEQPLHYLRVIARDWDLLTVSDQEMFRGGAMPPSTAAARIKAAKSRARS